jgi:multidrug efflux system membrane fusion protein
MVAVTAQIDDTERGQLRPGAFAQVTVPIEIRDAATVIPQGAVRPSERGFIAFIVEGEIAHERALELGMRTPEGEVEVLSGLEPGESLVVRGAEALRDGARVRVAAAAAGDGAADGAGVGVNN